MSFSKTITLSLTAILVLTLAACGGNGGSNSEIRLQGAGATFPNPLYQKWLSEYGKLHANVKIGLPVDRLGRRHQANPGPHGRLWCV